MAEQPADDKQRAEYLTDLQVRKNLTTYVTRLNLVAGRFEKDRTKSAWASIAMTVRLLHDLGLRGHLFAPLMEAAEIVQKELNSKALPKNRAEKVFEAIAVKFQIDCGLDEDRACRKVLAKNEPKVINNLKNFIGALTRASNPNPRENRLYFETIASDYRGLTAEAAADKSLRVCRAMKGKKV